MSYIAIQRNIAEGKSLLFFSILFAVLIRVLYFFQWDGDFQLREFPDAGYLWFCIAPLFTNLFTSMLAAFICVAVLALSWNHIDVKNVILREKSVLAPAFIILTFSTNVAFMQISPYLIISVLLLWAIGQLFSSYHSSEPTIACANTGIIVILASLFSPLMLLYFVVFIIGCSMMNIINFRSLLALLLSIVFVYVPAYFISVGSGTLDLFLHPFERLELSQFTQLAIRGLETWELVFACILLFIFGWMSVHNNMNSFRDKIKTRTFISFLGLIEAVSVVAFFILNYDYRLNLYIGFTAGAMLLAHYFALTQQKIMMTLFSLLLICCFIVCYISF